MTTANSREEATSSMSNEAYDLINCFYEGLDEVVRDLAQRIAVSRQSYIADEGKQVIAIEVEHVKEAGRLVIEALRKEIDSTVIPQELINVVDGMQECLESKSV